MRHRRHPRTLASCNDEAMVDGGDDFEAYWSNTPATVCERLRTNPQGLSAADAETRLREQGPNLAVRSGAESAWPLALRLFRSPLVLLLVGATILSLVTGDATQAAIIAGIVLASATLGFIQEHRASRALAELQARLRTVCRVRRGGQVESVSLDEIVPGDVVELSAGSLVPADGIVLDARNCFAVQAALTGESFPVEKSAEITAATSTPAQRSNVLFMGSSLRSGTATMLVVRTGRQTVFGELAARLKQRRPATEFERGIARFSALLTQFVLVLALVVTAVNLGLHRAPTESLLFALALAVGMTPELLPAIVTYTLSHGARSMAAKGVLVRHLSAIEDLGSMTMLCTDKTGTLTSGAASLAGAVGADGEDSPRVTRLGVVNARLQGGLRNPLDDLLVTIDGGETRHWLKADERPYDFQRRRLTVSAELPDGSFLSVCKGAHDSVLSACARVRRGEDAVTLSSDDAGRIRTLADTEASNGRRVLAVATKVTAGPQADEDGLVFEGLLLFEDPLKPGLLDQIETLRRLGVRLKMLTGDRAGTAVHVARSIGIAEPRVLTGGALHDLSAEALWNVVPSIDVFAEVDPGGKERIIRALKARGEVVGFLGDGINDAPALHVADIGLSVQGAVDVAREAADLVLLSPDLHVIADGIVEGRTTFANTQKYILSTSSANLGNMLSMAIASWVLPFLPLTAAQILLNNVLSDAPALALGSDRVDSSSLSAPPRWSVAQIRRFTLVFGAVSSMFDVVTFIVLLHQPGMTPVTFRGGWFIESLASEVLVLLIIRTRLPVWRARPGQALALASIAVLAIAAVLVQTGLGRSIGFEPLSPTLLLYVAAIALVYAVCVEGLKRRLYSLAS